jgi:hypothetical protein
MRSSPKKRVQVEKNPLILMEQRINELENRIKDLEGRGLMDAIGFEYTPHEYEDALTPEGPLYE